LRFFGFGAGFGWVNSTSGCETFPGAFTKAK
jgi:hypothetical protein